MGHMQRAQMSSVGPAAGQHACCMHASLHQNRRHRSRGALVPAHAGDSCWASFGELSGCSQPEPEHQRVGIAGRSHHQARRCAVSAAAAARACSMCAGSSSPAFCMGWCWCRVEEPPRKYRPLADKELWHEAWCAATVAIMWHTCHDCCLTFQGGGADASSAGRK